MFPDIVCIVNSISIGDGKEILRWEKPKCALTRRK